MLQETVSSFYLHIRVLFAARLQTRFWENNHACDYILDDTSSNMECVTYKFMEKK